jgi:hypothetical protein
MKFIQMLIIVSILVTTGCSTTNPFEAWSNGESKTWHSKNSTVFYVFPNGKKNVNSSIKMNTGTYFPGIWTKYHFDMTSKQHFLRNEEDDALIGISISNRLTAVVNNPNMSESELLDAYYRWDAEYHLKIGHPVNFLKINRDMNYIVWKMTEQNTNTYFVFGVRLGLIYNFSVSSQTWSEEKQIEFIENMYVDNIKSEEEVNEANKLIENLKK